MKRPAVLVLLLTFVALVATTPCVPVGRWHEDHWPTVEKEATRRRTRTSSRRGSLLSNSRIRRKRCSNRGIPPKGANCSTSRSRTAHGPTETSPSLGGNPVTSLQKRRMQQPQKKPPALPPKAFLQTGTPTGMHIELCAWLLLLRRDGCLRGCEP
jgi:hypothetical protein